MRIGIFTDTYYPQINGVATSARILEQELSRLGHTVFIFTTTDPKAKGDVSPRVFRLPSMPFVFLPSHRFNFIYPPRLLLRMKRFKLDIIHTQTEFPIGIFGSLVSGFYGIPQIHTYHTMYEDYTHYVANGHLITPKMAKQYSRIFCNRALAVIAPVEKTRRSLVEYGVRSPIHVIPTGLIFHRLRPENFTPELVAETRQALGLKPEDAVVLFIGRIAKEKSIDVILRAMPDVIKAMPHAKLLIIGSGPLLCELQELAAQLKIENSVIFAGSRPWDEIGLYYQLGDVFVTASTSETQGLTYIEAMAAKRLVIAKKDPSTEGVIIHGETGYNFENDDELPALLCRVLNNPYEVRAVVQNSAGAIEHLSSTEFGKKVSELYEEVLVNYVPKRGPSILRLLNQGFPLKIRILAKRRNKDKS